mmetsp:Transcript_15398/g.20071  ORF Transcript_15398/g.20071 Transcript_15398/m.20071 type:complete len:252 (+) Transcript_15398:207-962(+)|eukprot:CAMPEP_0198150440 /NCGR_PEP_ID=MMETSP1443-20131203/50939_1 /TAXON_ID=186043 /ORGANISM="Entomoneis sp., Strain CCMP2396" /LENGTH=251 /DNA_ID=CAMNT_0043815739 /DNA_START=96 /DNA_END=851 /DNA_ORIENTATION=-
MIRSLIFLAATTLLTAVSLEGFSPCSRGASLVALPPSEKEKWILGRIGTYRLSNALWATPRGGGGLFGTNTDSSKAKGGGGGGFGKKTINRNGNDKNKKDESEQEDSRGGTTLFEIRASKVKVAPLRFLLTLFLSGDVQHRPVRKSWLAHQSERDGEIEIYYSDGTGVISIQLKPDTIKFVRVGKNPSLVYQLQESVLLHSVLDELDKVAFGQAEEGSNKPIDPTKRLLQFENEKVIDDARKLLPARAEDS